VQADVRDAVGSGRHEIDRARLGEVSLRADEPGADPIPREPAGDEDDVSVDPRDTATAVCERLDL